MSEITIDSHVKVPRPKLHIEAERINSNLFRAYANAYEACHIRRPVLLKVTKAGYFQIDTLPQAVTGPRLKALTRMLRERIKDR